MMKKILLVDDDQDFGESVKEHLEYEGYQVTHAFDGDEGLACLDKDMPDLILTDLIMPGLDGMGFIRQVKKSALHSSVKMIAMSGGGRIAGNEYLEQASAFGVDAIFEKPFDVNDLIAEIEQLLAATQVGQSRAVQPGG